MTHSELKPVRESEMENNNVGMYVCIIQRNKYFLLEINEYVNKYF
jgi:hypothetical protein